MLFYIIELHIKRIFLIGSVKYTAVIAAFDIDNVAVHNIDIAVAYFYPDIVLHIMLKHSVKNAFYSFGAEGGFRIYPFALTL